MDVCARGENFFSVDACCIFLPLVLSLGFLCHWLNEENRPRMGLVRVCAGSRWSGSSKSVERRLRKEHSSRLFCVDVLSGGELHKEEQEQRRTGKATTQGQKRKRSSSRSRSSSSSGHQRKPDHPLAQCCQLYTVSTIGEDMGRRAVRHATAHCRLPAAKPTQHR